nr:class I SAM-dependent methyltransferase [Maliibacterium massiliense]
MFITQNWQDFAVLDAGDGEKLERWGHVLLRRPDPQAIWPKDEAMPWQKVDARYERAASGGGKWRFYKTLPERWSIRYKDLQFYVHPTGFKHTGLFPEQAVNWDFMRACIEKAGRPVRVLNLFAYTGGATLACAQAGARVVHVDAAKGMVLWAKENAQLSGLGEASIRYIVDDCEKFVQRELRRGNRYDGIVMDPPSYGRGPGGEVWRLEDKAAPLVALCAQLLSDAPLFFLVNAYTTGLQPAVLQNLLTWALKDRAGTIDAQEVCLPTARGLVLPCGAAGRFTGA